MPRRSRCLAKTPAVRVRLRNRNIEETPPVRAPVWSLAAATTLLDIMSLG
jgi:hypothetical protein